MLARWGAALAVPLIAACGGAGTAPCDATCAQDFFVNRSAVVLVPDTAPIAPGGSVAVDILLVEPVNDRRGPGSSSYRYRLASVQRAEADERGVVSTIVMSSFIEACAPSVVPATIFEEGVEYYCRSGRLTIETTPEVTNLGSVMLRAEWAQIESSSDGADPTFSSQPVVQFGHFRPRLAEPDFELTVVPLAKVYATSGVVTVAIARRLGFAAPVELSLDSFGSGIAGTFTHVDASGAVASGPVPVGVDTAQLRLHLPASMGGGYFTPLKVVGRGGGIERSSQFGQLVEPLYTVGLTTADGGPAVVTPTRPLDLEVTIAFDPFGPFSLIGPGRIELSLPDPPPGVMATFLPDSQPTSTDPAALVLRRTLRFSGPSQVVMGDLRIRATAVQLAPDLQGVRPFAEGKLPLRIDPAQSWEYVNSGAAYGLVSSDTIGLGIQRNDYPAVAWLEGPAGGPAVVYLKRFDGATFAPSPPPDGIDGKGLSVAGGQIEQARMALSSNDDAHVAFTYKLGTQEGARLGLGRVGAGAVNWSVHDEVTSLPPAQHARSPRIAAGLNDSLALSYLVETGIPAGAGLLYVRSRRAAGALSALPSLQGDGWINVSSSGQVLRDTPSLALRADGNPWLAWIEEPFAPAGPLPPALWLRGHDGIGWGPPIPVSTRQPLVAAPTQLLALPSGVLVVAWLEASPARLMVAAIDPATGNATPIRDAANPTDGALNATGDSPARDIALNLDVRGRIVVSWTEGGTQPLLYAKRLNARGTWDGLGTAVDAARPTRSPFVAGDATGRLYVAWTGFFGSTNLDSLAPKTDILVGRWIFTEDY